MCFQHCKNNPRFSRAASSLSSSLQGKEREGEGKEGIDSITAIELVL